MKRGVIRKYLDTYTIPSSSAHKNIKQQPVYPDKVIELRDDIVKSSVTLLKDYDIKQKQIFEWIREGLKEYSSQFPKTRVLYNTTYGGYGLSDDFVSYCASYSESPGPYTSDKIWRDQKTHREKYVEYIIPFAKYVLKSPQYNCKPLFYILYLYEHYELADVVSLVNMYIRKLKERVNINRNMEKLKAYLNCPTSIYLDIEAKKTKIPDYCYYKPQYFIFTFNDTNFSEYLREDLEEFLQKEDPNPISKIENDIKVCKETILSVVSEHVLNDIIAYITYTYKEFKKNKEGHFSLSTYMSSREEYKTFIELLKSNGFDSYKTWHGQTKFEEEAIHYLIYKYKSLSLTEQLSPEDVTVYDFLMKQEHIEINKEVSDLVVLNFGLLCASGQCCQLGIEEIPSMVDYSIGEYDGNETVYIV